MQSLIIALPAVVLEAPRLVIEDPDSIVLEEHVGIEIFEPGSDIEREVDWDRLFQVLVYTGAAWALTMGLLVVILIPLIVLGLVGIDFVSLQILFAPWSFLILTLSEVGFLVPPIVYARRHNLPLASIGLKVGKPITEALYGLLYGMAMLVANLAITFFIGYLIPTPTDGSDQLFAVSGLPEFVAWVAVMFCVVGLGEEVAFRGFLQRRVEIYFQLRRSDNKRIALIITAVIFSAVHLDIIGFPARFVLGLFLGRLAQRRRYSIIGPAFAHGFNNSMVVLLASLGF